MNSGEQQVRDRLPGAGCAGEGEEFGIPCYGRRESLVERRDPTALVFGKAGKGG